MKYLELGFPAKKIVASLKGAWYPTEPKDMKVVNNIIYDWDRKFVDPGQKMNLVDNIFSILSSCFTIISILAVSNDFIGLKPTNFQKC